MGWNSEGCQFEFLGRQSDPTIGPLAMPLTQISPGTGWSYLLFYFSALLKEVPDIC